MQTQATVQQSEQALDIAKMGNSAFAAYCGAQADGLKHAIRNTLMLNMLAIVGGVDPSRKPTTFGLLRVAEDKRQFREIWNRLVMRDMATRASQSGTFDLREFRFILASLCYQWMPGFLDANAWSALRSTPWQKTKH